MSAAGSCQKMLEEYDDDFSVTEYEKEEEYQDYYDEICYHGTRDADTQSENWTDYAKINGQKLRAECSRPELAKGIHLSNEVKSAHLMKNLLRKIPNPVTDEIMSEYIFNGKKTAASEAAGKDIRAKHAQIPKGGIRYVKPPRR